MWKDEPMSELTRRIRSFVALQRFDDLLGAALGALGFLGLSLLAVMLLQIPGWFALIGLAPALLFVRRGLRRRGLVLAARRIEQGFPVLQQRLLPAAELAAARPDTRLGYSDELAGAAVEDAWELLRPLAIDGLVRWRKTLAGGVLLLTALVLGLAAVRFAPQRLHEGWYLSFLPAHYPLELSVTPGDARVEKGKSVVLLLTVKSPFDIRQGVLEREAPAGLPTREPVVIRDSIGSVEVTVTGEFDYSFHVRGRGTPSYHIALQQPLEITGLGFKYHYPRYSRLPDAASQSRELSALVGTRVEFLGSADQTLASGSLVWLDDTLNPVPLKLDGKSFRGELTVRRAAEFEIRLTDVTGTINAPARFRVSPIADELPFVRLFAPGADMNLPSSMKVMLGANSVDDYGLTSLVLSFVKDSAVTNVSLKSIAEKLEDTTFYVWDLSRLDLLPGSSIQYYVTVYDNDVVSGPKASRSETFSLRFPTLTDLFTQATQKTAEIESLMTPLSEQQKQLQDQTGKLDDALKRNRELSWEEQQSLQNLMGNQDSLLAAVRKLHEDVRKAMNEMLQGAVLDSEAMNGLHQLDTLLSQVLPKQLMQALDSLRQSLAKNSQQNMKSALQNFQYSQADMQKAIDRAVDLLKRLRQEQEMNSLVRKAEELVKEQEKILKNPSGEKNDQLAQREQQIGQALDTMAAKMNDLASQLDDKALSKDLQDLAQQMAQDSMSQQAQSAAQDFQQSKRSSAQQKGMKLQSGLKSLQQKLQEMKDRMQQRRSTDITNKLLQAANDLLTVSDAQEELEPRIDQTRDLASLVAEENRLSAAARIVAETLAALSMRNMMVPPQLGEPVIKSMKSADDAAQALQSGSGSGAKAGAAGARAALNQAVAAILSTLQSAQQGGGFGGDMQSMMDQLSRATSEQMSLGQGMGSLPIPIPGGMSPGQAQQWSDLMARQQALRQMLEQMMKGGGQQPGGMQPGMSGSVEAAIEEMKQLEQDLASLNQPRPMVDRSQRIVNKLLDAQRSIRQRENNPQREAESGKAFATAGSPRLPADLGERKKLLREELMRALKEDFPREYEPNVKAYFDALLKQ
jgi:hypothetical protein